MREIRRRWGCFRVKYGSLREFNQPKIVILWELISGFLPTKHGDPTGTSGISPIEQWLLDQYIGGLSQSMNGESRQYEPTSTSCDWLERPPRGHSWVVTRDQQTSWA